MLVRVSSPDPADPTTPPDAFDPPTRIVLIRHGESASNAGGWLSGQETCGGLTDRGIAQAEALRERLALDADLRPDVVLVSTMKRAVHTAEIVSEPTPHTPEQHADLMERTSGEAEGLTIEEYTEKYGQRPWIDWHNPLSPGGESGPEFTERVVTALDRVAADHAGRTVWVVCHGGVIMVNTLVRWMGASGRADLRELPIVSPQNTSIAEWYIEPDGRWRMVRYNDHTHLVGLDDGAALDAPAAV